MIDAAKRASAKFVNVVKGKILEVVIDLRNNSKNFGMDRVQSFWMYYMIEESPAPGEEQKGIYL